MMHDSKPMCEWTTSRAQRIESVTGFSEPAAKGAIVRGMRPAETILGHCQLCSPSRCSASLVFPCNRKRNPAMNSTALQRHDRLHLPKVYISKTQ